MSDADLEEVGFQNRLPMYHTLTHPCQDQKRAFSAASAAKRGSWRGRRRTRRTAEVSMAAPSFRVASISANDCMQAARM